MATAQDRRLSYKLPPSSIRASSVSQEVRRSQALEEQKRRRAQRVDSTRQLDLFANLNLNDDSDDGDIAEEDEDSTPAAAPSAVGPYVALLKASDVPESSDIVSNSLEIDSSRVITCPQPLSEAIHVGQLQPTEKKRRKKRNSKKRSGNYNKPSKWADQCMYAELLEMSAEEHFWSDGEDGLPQDLETGWVALAPVPVGKRCLVVTHQSPGLGGMVQNTTLRSRLLGKALIARFPSPLPALTVLDCILDANWRDNGIIHVLDVIRWKGQDVGDCEAPFRFWWRDTRLGELSRTLPPTINFLSQKPKQGNLSDSTRANPYQFPYPTYFVAVPYHTNISLASLDSQVIPAARSIRSITINVPSPVQPSDNNAGQELSEFNFSMDIEAATGPNVASTSSQQFMFSSSTPSVALSPSHALIQSDGLLLYVSEASYEPGTSPLSSWVPISGFQTEGTQPDRAPWAKASDDGPLELFHRLIKRRLNRGQMNSIGGHPETDTAMHL